MCILKNSNIVLTCILVYNEVEIPVNVLLGRPAVVCLLYIYIYIPLYIYLNKYLKIFRFF